MRLVLTAFVLLGFVGAAIAQQAETAWPRHTIDNTSRGADGVRPRDVNGDGLPDFVTGWEEGGVIRVYIHPGTDAKVKQAWPMVTVGKVRSPEDAVFVDLDNDGAVDVVSSCEGGNKTMYVHWAPKDPKDYLNADAWKTEPIPASKQRAAWMFALPMQIDGRGGVDLVVSAKGKDAMVGWLQSPEDPRDLAAWKLHKLYDAGWIMSLEPADIDADGDVDIFVSDRKGGTSGVLWIENPGEKSALGKWSEHRIGADGKQVMFLDVLGVGSDVITAIKPNEVHWFRRPKDVTEKWPCEIIPVGFKLGIGDAKSVRVGDIDGDGRLDLVYSCENASNPKRGVFWMKQLGDGKWDARDIAGPGGVKFDLLQLLDLDRDGDLDVITCEERDNLGVIWYENPTKE